MEYIIYSLLLLFAATIMKTLLFAFRETEDGGLGRLSEKYPDLARHSRFYERRWGEMSAGMSLLAVLAQTGAVLMPLIAWRLGLYDSGVLVPVLVALLLLQFFLLEILPEIVGQTYSDRLSALALPFAGLISYLFFFVVWPLHAFGKWLDAHLHSASRDRPTAEEEIISLVEQADAGDIDLHEKEFIRSVFEFDDKDVHEIMTPRIDIEAIEGSETVADCVARIRDIPHSRFPVYNESLDDILGIVHVKDLLCILSNGRGEDPMRKVASPAAFVPESMRIANLFELIKNRRTHLAIVVDEYGGTAGVVALEDVIEELIGDIQDESDRESPGISRLADGSWIAFARESLAEINEKTGLAIPESEQYDSIGGFVFHQLNRIPVNGETVAGEGFRVEVEKASDRQIETVRIVSN